MGVQIYPCIQTLYVHIQICTCIFNTYTTYIFIYMYMYMYIYLYISCKNGVQSGQNSWFKEAALRWCVCMCAYTHIYTTIHTHIHVSRHAHAMYRWMNASRFTCVSTYVCIHAYMHPLSSAKQRCFLRWFLQTTWQADVCLIYYMYPCAYMHAFLYTHTYALRLSKQMRLAIQMQTALKEWNLLKTASWKFLSLIYLQVAIHMCSCM